jgi:hypothetical protein
VQLDRVWGDVVLTVVGVEEGDAGHNRFGADLDLSPRLRHLEPPYRLCVLRAVGGRRLGNHCVLAIAEDDVQVLVDLWVDVRHGGGDAEMCRSNGSRVLGRRAGAGRLTR